MHDLSLCSPYQCSEVFTHICICPVWMCFLDERCNDILRENEARTERIGSAAENVRINPQNKRESD